MAVFVRKIVCCRFERLATTIWTHRQTTKKFDLGQLWTCLVKPIKDLIPTWSSLSSREIYKSPLTGETINRKLCEKVLTRVIVEFYTKQPDSSPFFLVNGSEKPNIHSLKKSNECLFLIETTEKLRILTYCLRHEQFIDWPYDFD